MPSALGPQPARALLGQLVEVESAVGRLSADLVETERREREDNERRAQQKAWDEAQAAAQRKLAAAEAAQKEALTSLAALEAALGDLATQADLDPKDLKVKQKRLRDDAKKAELRAQQEAQAAASAGEILKDSFVFRPSAAPVVGKGAASFVPPPARAAATVPDDALPQVGRLRTRGPDRFLAIGAWEHLDVGETEAARLKATLVADLGAA